VIWEAPDKSGEDVTVKLWSDVVEANLALSSLRLDSMTPVMANSTAKTSVPSSLRNLSLPAWLVLVCIVAFTILLGAGTAAANRPNAPFSYTANWPHDPLIGNQPPPQFLIWSIVSVVVLIAAIALAKLIRI
jgi:hypothetical protein